MSSWMKVGIAVIVLLGISLAFYFLLNEHFDEIPIPIDMVKDAAASNQGEGGIDSEAEQKEEAILQIEENGPEGDALPKEALAPEGLFITGRVIDKDTKEPVRSFCINMSRWFDKGSGPWREFLSKKVEDEEGRFSFPLDQAGRIRCWVRSSRYQVYRTDVTIPEEGGLPEQEFALDPGLVAAGRVVDDATGFPVEGVLVAPADRPETTELIRILHGFDQWSAYTRTDAEGRFRLTGLWKSMPPWLDGKWRIAAVHPDYAEGVGRGTPGEKEEIEIRLKKGHRLFGIVRDDEGRPVSNIMVSVTGNEIPLPRPVLSGPDGSYRTAPCLPGRVLASAGPPPGRSTASQNFTEEKVRVFVKDRDLELDFGPSADYVTWRGTLHDGAGEPISRGTIEIEPTGLEQVEDLEGQHQRTVECDNEGRFEIGKLALGEYTINVQPTSWAANVSLDNITLEVPGVLERDLFITGAIIQGYVVDKMTGEPVPGKWGSVSTSLWAPDHRYFSCPLDENARFALTGLPPGEYRLSVSVRGYPHLILSGYRVKKNEVLEDLRLELSSGGELLLRILGFAETDPRTFQMSISPADGQRYHGWDYNLEPDGTYEHRRDLEVGPWLVTLSFGEIGYFEEEVEIKQGRTTEVTVLRSDIGFFEGFISVAGSVTYPDGTPVPDTPLNFYAYNAPGIEKSARLVRGTTDEFGRFYISGFKPGRWTVGAQLQNGNSPNFPDLIIPGKPEDPYPLDLVLHEGKVSGTLFDSLTGQAFTDEGPKWWVFCRDLETSRNVSEIQGGQTGPAFTLSAVPECDFQVTVIAKGYQDFTSGTLHISEGGSVNLGRIGLSPSGILILEVVDEAGTPMDTFEATCNGKAMYYWERDQLGPGKYRYYKLPVGRVALVVKAEGMVDEELTLDLDAGRSADVRAVMYKQQ